MSNIDNINHIYICIVWIPDLKGSVSFHSQFEANHGQTYSCDIDMDYADMKEIFIYNELYAYSSK